MAVEITKLLSRNPQFLMIMVPHNMNLELRTIIVIYFKSGYVAFMIRRVFYIPLFRNLRSIFFIEDGIKNLLVR